MFHWYVLRITKRRERLAYAYLAGRHVEVYLPRAPQYLVRPGRSDLLFPGYLFAQYDLESEASLWVRSAPGVSYILGTESGPIDIPDDFFTEMHDRIEARRNARSIDSLRPGEKIYILDGPFREFDAVFDRRLSAGGRVRIFIQTLQNRIPVELHELAVVAY